MDQAARLERLETGFDWGRWYRPVMFGVTVLLVALALVVALLRLQAFDARGLVAIDYRFFMELGGRWVASGTMYLPSQFVPYDPYATAGTTDVTVLPALYPPQAGPAFAVWRLLPPILWWLVPIGVIMYVIVRSRPAPWAWPVLAIILALPITPSVLIVGGSTLWMTAGVAGALRWGWPAIVIALKPSFLPFLLVGSWRRSWWIGIVAFALATFLFLNQWIAYREVVRNATTVGALYSLGDLPVMFLPVVAWLAGDQSRARLLARSGRPFGGDPRARSG